MKKVIVSSIDLTRLSQYHFYVGAEAISWLGGSYVFWEVQSGGNTAAQGNK